MAKVMMTIQCRQPAPDLEAVKQQWGLSNDEIDLDFGVVEIDPSDGTCAVLVDELAASKISGTDDWSVGGPYSNPRIEPFGPPESAS